MLNNQRVWKWSWNLGWEIWLWRKKHPSLDPDGRPCDGLILLTRNMAIYGYGSIPIHTIFSGMNIHKSQLFWCELQGYKVLTHCHMDSGKRSCFWIKNIIYYIHVCVCMCRDGWMDGWMDVCMYICLFIYLFMYAFVYVSMYLFLYLFS